MRLEATELNLHLKIREWVRSRASGLTRDASWEDIGAIGRKMVLGTTAHAGGPG